MLPRRAMVSMTLRHSPSFPSFAEKAGLAAQPLNVTHQVVELSGLKNVPINRHRDPLALRGAGRMGDTGRIAAPSWIQPAALLEIFSNWDALRSAPTPYSSTKAQRSRLLTSPASSIGTALLTHSRPPEQVFSGEQKIGAMIRNVRTGVETVAVSEPSGSM